MRKFALSFSRAALVLIVLLVSLLLFGEEARGQDKNEKRKKNAEPKQALQDSLARAAYEIELNRSWSFGFQHYRNRQYAEVPRFFWKVVAMDTAQKPAKANAHGGASAANDSANKSAPSRAFPQVFDFLGQTYLQLSKPDSAQLVYELGVKTLPNDASLRRNLAYLLAARSQFDLALAEYEHMIALGAATEDDYRRMANLYARTDRYDKAIAACEMILALNPNDAEIRRTLSALYKAAGKEDAALESMEKALAQNPNDTRMIFDLARAYFNRQVYEKVVELLPRFNKLVPGDLLALELLGDAQARLSHFRDALETYGQIVAAKADDKKVLVKIADCYRELGDFSAARRFANKALVVDAQYGAAYFALGQVYETCAGKCVAQKGKAEFDDKLVFELAYFQYEKALQDLATRTEARQRLNFLEASIPNKEDRFMNRGKTKAAGPCYQWIY
jgi:tetratricopeptide (TPR) repeat protein